MKRIIPAFALLIILLCLSPAALASSNTVVDEADLLTIQQEEDLAAYAQSIRSEYDIDVAIVIVSSSEGKSAQGYADDYFDYNGYGVGDDDSGVLFLLAIQDREYAISTYGKAIDALSDRDIDELLDSVYDSFRSGNYYMGLRTYLDTLESELHDYAQPKDPNYASIGVISLAVGAGAGGIGLATMRSGMKTAKPQVGAQSYLANNSFTLPVNQDTFLYTRTSRTRIQHDSSSGGGGRGSTHTSSSGRSHGGGSRKF